MRLHSSDQAQIAFSPQDNFLSLMSPIKPLTKQAALPAVTDIEAGMAVEGSVCTIYRKYSRIVVTVECWIISFNPASPSQNAVIIHRSRPRGHLHVGV